MEIFTECTNASEGFSTSYSTISMNVFFVFVEDEETLCLKLSKTEYLKMVTDRNGNSPEYVKCSSDTLLGEKPVYFIEKMSITYKIDRTE